MSEDFKAVSNEELEKIAGGAGNDKFPIGTSYATKVQTGYLALRNAAAYDDKNIIGRLCNDSRVQIKGGMIGNYIYVQVTYSAPGDWHTDCEGNYGFVDSRYLV